jgi:hypothetical protein
MSSHNSGRKSPSAVGQPDKYDELEMSLLYSSPHLENGENVVGVDIDKRPPTPSDEAVEDSRGQELVPGNYARERSARMDAQYRAAATPYEASDADDQEAESGLPHERELTGRAGGTYADVRAVTQGQQLGDVVEGDVGELVRGVSTGAYWEQVLAEMDVPEPRRDLQAPFAEVSPEHYTLEAEERMRGEFEADERNRAKALAADVAEIDRAERSREDMRTRRPIRHSVSESDDPWEGPPAQTVGVERVDPADDEPVTRTPVRDGPDPRASLDQETLAQVNKCAARLAEHFQGEAAMSRASFGKCIARRVQKGSDTMTATITVRENLERMTHIKQPIGSIDPYDQWETTVEAEVITLWTPKHKSQYQVGVVQDDAGDTAKFTVWFAAGDKPTLAVGDRIRAEQVRVNAYEGDATLAVVGDTDIAILERGDGPRTRRKRMSAEPRIAPWSVESAQHAWINHIDMERAIEVTLGRRDDE